MRPSCRARSGAAGLCLSRRLPQNNDAAVLALDQQIGPIKEGLGVMHLTAAGVSLEGRTEWPRGGVSVYFRDPDDHLLEIATPGLWGGY
jgi:catechol 2,3-dioxygenase-like lactoylglutathione lyase family enzyme